MRAESPTAQIELTDLSPEGPLHAHAGALDVALGAIGTEETWQMAALGACDSRWALTLQRLAEARTNTGPTYLRFAPEMNGHWHPWSVTSAQRLNFITAWKRWRALQLDYFPHAYVVFCPAHRSTQDYNWTLALPGHGDFDVLGVAFHPHELPHTTEELQHLLLEVDAHGAPVGLEAFRRAALDLQLPLAISEWSNITAAGPSRILELSITNAVRALSGNQAGQILYACALTFPLTD